MTKEEIDSILVSDALPGQCNQPQLIETHISWVLLCDQYVYKIKKPVKFSFLDFSTLERRKHFCEREVTLNRRLVKDVYLDVQPVRSGANGILVGAGSGTIIDYAVRLRKLDPARRMDLLMERHHVSEKDITQLAGLMAAFHKTMKVVPEEEVLDIREAFNALAEVSDFAEKQLGESEIEEAIAIADSFIEQHSGLFKDRRFFYRDCHGDFHCQNVFLTPEPVVFDCIEFNDQFRYTDVLNEVAFLCMDLDAYGREDFSRLFIETYNKKMNVIRSHEEWQLFNFYKSYRANIRAKVYALRAMGASGNERERAVRKMKKYLELMGECLKNTMDFSPLSSYVE